MINIIVAEDHGLIRQALVEMLETTGDVKIIAQAENGEQLLKALTTTSADLVIMDLQMPKVDGLEALERMKREAIKSPPVLILSADDGERSIRSALKAGAKGYVPKNADRQELAFAIRSILEGKTYLSPSVTQILMEHGSSDDPLKNPLDILTKREREIMKHLADGKPNRDIGKMLHISIRTVDTHRSNIMKKLNAKTNADLVKLAIANDLITV